MRVSGQEIKVTNPEKVLFPETGFTKNDLIEYYLSVADVMLPYLIDRPLSVIRYPDGVSKPGFFGKNAPKGTPDWVRTARLPSPGSTKNRTEIDYIVVEEPATLAWLANLAAVELHVPQWHIDDHKADQLVFDLDPGEGTEMAESCEAALIVRKVLAAHGLEAYPKMSGGKGLHIYAPIAPREPLDGHGFAHTLAQELEHDHPDLIVSNMRKELRTGKILIDWSQNNPAKTTVATFSLRAKDKPTVSTPLTWRQVATGRPRVLDPGQVSKDATKLAAHFADLLDTDHRAELPAPQPSPKGR